MQKICKIWISALPETDSLRVLCGHIVATDAFRRTIPSFDLILTPNGFGIVSNQNVALASADRVNRLISSLPSNRDDLASYLLLLLARRPDWPHSERGQHFGATLWPSLSHLDRQLNQMRSVAVYYKEYSSIENLQLLDESYIKQIKRALTPLTFQTSILCKQIGIAKDGFYSSMRESHKYDASNFEYLDTVWRSNVVGQFPHGSGGRLSSMLSRLDWRRVICRNTLYIFAGNLRISKKSSTFVCLFCCRLIQPHVPS